MKIRRYVAPSLREAVVQVKQDMGAEAVILEVRRVRAPGLKGFFQPRRVEVTAAGGPEYQSQTVLGPKSVPQSPVLPRRERLALALGTYPAEAAGAESLLPERLRRPYALAREQVELLVKRGVRADLARELVEQAFAAVSEDKLTDGAALAAEVRRKLLRLFPQAPAEPLASRAVAFIGPTGVGKTTTIAKLAAVYSLQKGKQVALITADTYRIAAVDQLKRYAEILRVPLEVVFTPADLPAAISRHSGADLILIDTAGRSPRQSLHLAELRGLLEQQPDIEPVLVVSATTKADDLEQIYERFQPLRPRQLVITKLDETETVGSLLNLVKRARMPIGYITYGQNVPDDLEAASPERLVEMVLGGDSYVGPGRTLA